jgi:hypothetical protein
VCAGGKGTMPMPVITPFVIFHQLAFCLWVGGKKIKFDIVKNRLCLILICLVYIHKQWIPVRGKVPWVLKLPEGLQDLQQVSDGDTWN